MARRGSATFKGDYISSKLPRVSQYFVSDIPSRGNGLQKPWQKHDQTKHHQDHIWHCVPRCPFSHSMRCWISPMSDAGGRKPGVAGSHCACRWYLQSLQVSNSHWKCKKNTLDTYWHMESWSMDPARSEDLWERPRVCVNFWGRNQWCSTGRKEHLVGKSCQPLFFQSISIKSTVLKGYAKNQKNIRNFIHLSFLQRHNYYVFTICWHYVLHQFVASKSKGFRNPRSLKSSGHRVMRRFV